MIEIELVSKIDGILDGRLIEIKNRKSGLM